MNIRNDEDKLFATWRKKPGRSPFVYDGAPFPDLFAKSQLRALFVLKDCNLGNYDSEVFNLRQQMATVPDPWWSTVANWGQLINNLDSKEPSWSEVILEPVQQGLKQHSFMQLKKSGGVGGISDAELWDYANEDKKEIREQVEIYSPHVIIATGTGNIVKTILNCSEEKKQTSRGMGFWKVNLQSESPCYIIDFCHPSNRAGLKVRPSIGYGLRDACKYVRQLRENAYTGKGG